MHIQLLNAMYARMRLCLSVAIIASLPICTAHSQNTSNRRIWTIPEILQERAIRPIVKRPKYCNTGPFQPCVCAADVPSVVQYRPAVRQCGGKAAIVLSGKYKDVFSVVVRDKSNRDRWPVQGINKCSAFERDTLALNKCSAFKAQKVLSISDRAGDATVHCLGASGYSSLFRRVV